jgi:hypothetical protein
VLLFVLQSCSHSSHANDIAISGLRVHTRLAQDHPDVKLFGTYAEVKVYNLHRGMAPDSVDVVVDVEGTGVATVILDVAPVVGETGWAQTEGITDLKRLENTLIRMPSFYRLERTTPLRHKGAITFNAIDIRKIIATYSEQQYWPRKIVFSVGVVPVMGDLRLDNNVRQLELIVDPPD